MIVPSITIRINDPRLSRCPSFWFIFGSPFMNIIARSIQMIVDGRTRYTDKARDIIRFFTVPRIHLANALPQPSAIASRAAKFIVLCHLLFLTHAGRPNLRAVR